MNIVLNGEVHSVQSDRLSELLVELGFAGRRIATAVNGEFVPLHQRADCRLAEGDRLEVIAPLQGG